MDWRIYLKFLVFLDVQNEKSIVKENEIHRSKQHQHVPLSTQDEDESETSFENEENSLLDRLGVKIDDSLHQIFTAYVVFLDKYD